jgi:hypothetical protein
MRKVLPSSYKETVVKASKSRSAAILEPFREA